MYAISVTSKNAKKIDLGFFPNKEDLTTNVLKKLGDKAATLENPYVNVIQVGGNMRQLNSEMLPLNVISFGKKAFHSVKDLEAYLKTYKGFLPKGFTALPLANGKRNIFAKINGKSLVVTQG